jgi:hypothetical protein
MTRVIELDLRGTTFRLIWTASPAWHVEGSIETLSILRARMLHSDVMPRMPSEITTIANTAPATMASGQHMVKVTLHSIDAATTDFHHGLPEEANGTSAHRLGL